MQVRFLVQGDTGLVLEFGDTIDRKTAARVTRADRRLQDEIVAGRLQGVVDIIPTYRSLTVIFDPLYLPRRQLTEQLLPLLDDHLDAAGRPLRQWQLPVCYDPEYGSDLESVARSRKLSPAEVVDLHAGRIYTVYMIGFLPGFPYMGDLDPALQMPRRDDPRVRVPKGSVAIAGLQTAVYPWESPGGWQLLGRCPLPLFDAQRKQPALLAQGDQVVFSSIPVAEYQRLETAATAGTLDIKSFLSEQGETHA
jgi:KipI family sensor histidine kinase inhibitor